MATLVSSCCTKDSQQFSSEFRTVALVGPPNSGKTTVFNRLTGLRQKVANFPGVTVEQHSGSMKLESGDEMRIVDLPGIYSLVPHSEDEQVTLDVLSGTMPDIPKPDAIILVLDSTNLTRHLMLAAEVLKLHMPTLILLNMADALRANGGSVDVLALARELKAPVALVSGSENAGLHVVEEFFAAQHLPENTEVHLPVLQDPRGCREWATTVGKKASYSRPATPKWTKRLDSVFLHRWLGPAIFTVVVIGVFQSIFTLAQPVTDLMETVLTAGGKWIAAHMAPGILQSLIVDGAWKGVSSVVIFLPQIVILFLAIGILEDSGYLARAAVIADRSMARLGLNGKSFIPLLSAYACAVPAIMATRTIENKRDRIATILIAPFMTCSARLPVYTMIIAAFIPNKRLLGPLMGTRAAVMLSLYVVGFMAALVTARLLKSFVLKSQSSPFVMELPSYRMPTLRSLGLRIYDRSKAFLVRAGTVILAVTIVVWALTHLPVKNGEVPPLEQSYAAMAGHVIEPAIAPLGFNWKIGVGLVSSIVAREVIVGTLGTLYGADPETEGLKLHEALRRDLSFGGAIALVLFFALAMQCVSTLAVVRRETNSWRWPALQFTYMTVLAYTFALIAFQSLKHVVR